MVLDIKRKSKSWINIKAHLLYWFYVEGSKTRTENCQFPNWYTRVLSIDRWYSSTQKVRPHLVCHSSLRHCVLPTPENYIFFAKFLQHLKGKNRAFWQTVLSAGNTLADSMALLLINIRIREISCNWIELSWKIKAVLFNKITTYLSQYLTNTYRCDDTRGCVMQFWPPDDEYMWSKHVEALNKLSEKQNFVHQVG